MGIKSTLSITRKEIKRLIRDRYNYLIDNADNSMLESLATELCDAAANGECYYNFSIRYDDEDSSPYRYAGHSEESIYTKNLDDDEDSESAEAKAYLDTQKDLFNLDNDKDSEDADKDW